MVPPVAVRPLLARVCWYLAGIVVSAFCFAVTIRTGLGLGPLFVVQDGVHLLTGWSMGGAVMGVGLAVLLIAWALGERPGLGTIALPFLGGAAVDAILPRLGEVHGMGWRLLLCAIASWCITLGGALVIKADLGIAALDGVMVGLHRRTGWPIGPLRLGMEGAMLAGGWLLGGAVGVGTVIMGALIGHGLQFWLAIVGAPSLLTAPEAERELELQRAPCSPHRA